MPFDLQPNLKGELIRLRPLKPEDWDDLFAVASDALIWEQHPESDRYKEDVFGVFFKTLWNPAARLSSSITTISKSSGRRDFTVTIRKNRRSRLDGHFWRESI